MNRSTWLRFHSHTAQNTARSIIIAAASAGLVGCQNYAAQPLDLESHQDAVRERLAELVDRPLDESRPPAARTDAISLDDGLNPAEAEVIALFFNPDLRLARAQLHVRAAASEFAGLWEDPVFGFDGTELLSPSGPFEYGLTLGFTLPISGRLETRQQQADAELDLEQQRIIEREWLTRHELRRTWNEWWITTEQARLAAATLTRLESLDDLTTSLVRAGELSTIEQRSIDITRTAAATQLGRLEGQAATLRAQLLYAMGLPADSSVTLSPEPPITPTAVFDANDDQLIQHNPALDVARAEYLVAEAVLRHEIQSQYPDFELGFGYGSEGNDDRLLLGAAIAIPVLNANRGAIAEARARRDVARTEAEITYERLSRDLHTATRQHQRSSELLEQHERSVMDLVTQQEDDLRRLAELGEFDLFLLLKSLESSLDAATTRIELMGALHRAAIDIAALAGPVADTEGDSK